MNLLLIRLIIFAVLFFAGLKLYRMYREWKLDREAQERDSLTSDRMVRCAWCKVHLPEDDALRAEGEWFCSAAHRDSFLEERASKP